MRTSIALAALIALGAGCGANPRPSEDPTYEDADVQHEPIKQLVRPYFDQTVVIVPFVNKSLSRYRELGNSAPDVLAAMAIDAGLQPLAGKGGALEAVNEEAQYGQSEFVDPTTAAKLGKQYGAKYVLYGAITDYSEVISKSSGGFDALGVVEVGSPEKAIVFNVAVSSQLIDVETRKIVGADSMTRKKQKWEVKGDKLKILGVGKDKRQEIIVDNETMGAILRLCFATSLNKVVTQANQRARMSSPAGGGGEAPPPAGGAGRPPG